MNWTTLHVDDPTGSKCTMGSTASGEAGCQPSFDGPLANARQQCGGVSTRPAGELTAATIAASYV